MAFADGRFVCGNAVYPCALGRSGAACAVNKREGDGASPIGLWPARRVFFRPDRTAPPVTGLPVIALRPDDGWGDDPAEPHYNQLVPLPCRGSHERMWRLDGLYDLVVELGFNDGQPVAGRGSAIFMHIARPGFAATEGCIALAEADLRDVLAQLGGGSRIEIRG